MVDDADGLESGEAGRSVSLSWTANAESDLAGYRVLRGGEQIVSVGRVTTHTDSGLTAGSQHTYTVRAVDAAGNVSPDSVPVTATVPPAPAPVVSGTRYRVVNVNSAKALENPGSSRRAGTQLTQRTSGTSTNQRWTFTANGDDTYSIRNVASGLCADVSGSSQSAGAAVIQWTCTGSANQRWRVAPAASGGYTLVPAHSGRCLDVSGSSRLNGAPVIQWSCTGNANQRWTFTRVS